MSPLVVFPYNFPLILVVSSVTRRAQPATTILAITGNDIKAGIYPIVVVKLFGVEPR